MANLENKIEMIEKGKGKGEEKQAEKNQKKENEVGKRIKELEKNGKGWKEKIKSKI